MRSGSVSSPRCGVATRRDSCTTISRPASTSPSPASRRKASTRAGSGGDGMIGSSKICSISSRRAASIRAGKAGSSRRWSLMRPHSSNRSTSCARRRIGTARRERGAWTRPDSCRNRTADPSSAAPSGPNRLEVAEQEVAVLLVFDLRTNFPGEGQVRSEVSLPARDGIGAGEGLVGEGEREVLDPVFLACREGSDRVVCRGLGTTEDCIDVGDLPIADRAIHRRSDLAPVEAGSVRGVDHALVFGGRAVLLEEPPDLVEETYGHLALPLPLRRGGFPRHGFPSAESRSEEHTSELQSRQYLVCRLPV